MKCPHCSSLLFQVPDRYTLHPTPQGFYDCSGCKRAYAHYAFPGEASLFAWLAESEIEPWDHFVARKRAEQIHDPISCRECGEPLLPVDATFATACKPKTTERCIGCAELCYRFDVDGSLVTMWPSDKDPTESFSEFVGRMIAKHKSH